MKKFEFLPQQIKFGPENLQRLAKLLFLVKCDFLFTRYINRVVTLDVIDLAVVVPWGSYF